MISINVNKSKEDKIHITWNQFCCKIKKLEMRNDIFHHIVFLKNAYNFLNFNFK